LLDHRAAANHQPPAQQPDTMFSSPRDTHRIHARNVNRAMELERDAAFG
jgi:hypothetical protein